MCSRLPVRVTLVTLVVLYGAFALVDGVLAVAAAIMARPQLRAGGSIVGLRRHRGRPATFLRPGVSALVLLVFIAIWTIVTGKLQIVGAIQLRKEIGNEWLLIAGGALSVLFGLAVLVRPGAGALALIFVIGAFAIAYGMVLVGFAFRLRRHSHARSRAHGLAASSRVEFARS